MKLRHAGTILTPIVVLLTGCASVEQKTARAAEELDAIGRWWPGRYVGEASLPGSSEPVAIAHEIAAIHAPLFGDRVYAYALRRADGDILQQKIFAFDTDPLRERNRMRAWVLAPEQMDSSLATTPARWQQLRPAALMSFPDTCAFTWRRTKKGFTGSVSPEVCEFDSRAFGQRIRPDMSYEINGEALTWRETLTGADGSVVATTGGTLRAQRDGPIIDVRRSLYDVSGSTVIDIRRDLYANSPIVADGETRATHTEWTILWNIERNETESGCRIDSVATTVEVRYLLPRLASRDTVTEELRMKWDTYLAALVTHELRHQQFAVEAARRIETKLPKLGSRASCEPLAEEADRVAAGVIDGARRRERQYDTATRHGYSEGAVFAPVINW